MPTLDLGKVVGPQGPAGRDGERGPQGIQGIQGPQGVPGPGVPAGGTPGQILSKDSAADYDTKWSDNTAAQVSYNAAESGLEAETVQAALDQLSTIKAYVGRVSNENLLDNWYFPDPINQRGQTEYTGSGYTIDRWKNSAGVSTCSKIIDGGIEFTPTATSNMFRQDIDNPKRFKGRTVSISFLASGIAGTKVNVYIRAYKEDGTYTYVKGNSVNTLSISTATFEIPEDVNLIYCGVQNSIEGGLSFLIAAKLELGPVQTLAHQDADGNWVLNDPPPDKTLEFLKCRRYFKSIGGRDTHISGYRYYSLFTGVVCNVPDVPMRATPALSRGNISNIVAVQNGVSYAVSSVEALSEKIFRFLTEKEIPERGPVSIYCNDTVFLNADL